MKAIDPETIDMTATPLPWTVRQTGLVAANGVTAGVMRSPALADHTAEMLNSYKAIHDEAVKVLSDLEKGRAAADAVLLAAGEWVKAMKDTDRPAQMIWTERLKMAVAEFEREKERQFPTRPSGR